ncbi:MAG: tetratricopeptide repeat protein [Planctomycetes bacterium]|nr:tetratricopeptide repeat protein [Planctomycetota bacterium]
MLLALLVAAAYANSFAGAFVLDDGPNLVASTKLAPLWPPTADLWADPGRGLSGRPLAAFSFAVDRALHGLDPRGYHATNLVIHVLAAWALFAVVRDLLGLARAPQRLRERRDSVAFAVAALWAVHPLQTTAVTYVVQRCESLMGLLFLVALLAALRSVRAERRAKWVAVSVACMALGALVKESIAVLPCVVLVLDVGFESGSLSAAWRARKRLYLALAAVWLWIAGWVLLGGAHRASAAGLLPELTWWAWLRSQAAALAHYARMTVWPDAVPIDYGWPIPRELVEWLPAGVAVLAVLAFAGLAFARGSRIGAVLLAGFLLLAPTSSVMPIPFELWALHRMYLPLAVPIGLAVALVGLGIDRARHPRLASGGALGVLLALLALAFAATRRANAMFESPERLWRAHVAARPENDRAWFQLGEALRASGDLPGALAAYRNAAELHPTYPLWLNNLATLELALGELDAAILHYELACRLMPDALLERANLVEALLARGDVERAERELAPLVARSPNDASVQRLSARVLARSAREAQSLSALQLALKLDPRDFGAFETLVLLRATAEDPAVRDVAAAQRFLDNLRSPPPSRAAELARLAAVVAAAAGRFDEAQRIGRDALELARREGRATLAGALERELGTYARREPPRAFVR